MSNDNNTLADVQPGGRVRLGDQAERARFETLGRTEGLPLARGKLGGYAFEVTAKAWRAWQYLSAKPSPGGQGDAPEIEQIRTLVSSILSTVSLGHQKGPYAYAGEDFGRYLAEATRDCRAILRALSDLAARQPVGEPVTDAGRSAAYDAIDRFLRNNMDDEAYAAYVEHLEALWAAVPAQAVNTPQPVAFDYPKFNAVSMGCVLEDRGVHFLIDAAQYGFDEALDQMKSTIESIGPLYAAPPAQAVDLGRWSQRHADDLHVAVHTALSVHAGSLSQKKRAAISAYVKRLLIDSQAVGK